MIIIQYLSFKNIQAAMWIHYHSVKDDVDECEDDDDGSDCNDDDDSDSWSHESA